MMIMDMILLVSYRIISLEIITTFGATLRESVAMKKANLLVSLQPSFAVQPIQVGCNDKLGKVVFHECHLRHVAKRWLRFTFSYHIRLNFTSKPTAFLDCASWYKCTP